MQPMKEIYFEYKNLFKIEHYRRSIFAGLIFLMIAAVLTSISIGYADIAKGNSVGDLLLDNLPKLDLFWFRTIGTALIAFSIVVIGFLKPKHLPALSKTIALMYTIRAFFLPLTHLKFYPEKILIPPSYSLFSQIPFSGNDLFFSGHVAFPLVAAFVFWEDKKLRYLLIFLSVISGLASLFAKTHYSIDIFVVPFMVYSIFKISERIFKKDFEYFRREI